MKDVQPRQLSKEELLERQYKEKTRDIKIARMRASVVRNQIVEIYSLLENIRFDYVSDTAFREYIVRAKKELEGALGDFLMDDTYWKERLEKHYSLTPEGYDEMLKNNSLPTKSAN